MQVLKFTIPITPVGQMRARHSRRGTYKDPKQRQREEHLNLLIKRYRPPEPLKGPLLMGARVYLPIPKSKTKKWKEQARAGLIRPVVKPDLDNAMKHLKDCMEQMGFFGNDMQIVGYLPETGKYYSDNPRWEIELRPWIPEMGLLEVA